MSAAHLDKNEAGPGGVGALEIIRGCLVVGYVETRDGPKGGAAEA